MTGDDTVRGADGRNASGRNDATRDLVTRAAAGGMTRREVVGLLALTAVAAACGRGEMPAGDTAAVVARPGTGPGFPGAPLQFFTEHEMDTVRVLADIVIPRDERSGSATDAGVPEFMDFMMNERESARPGMRGGLAWLDRTCQDRFAKTFVDCTAAERMQVVDDIAWPERARPEMSHGVAFFNAFRDLTAGGFWSSRMGVEDLQYLGNRPQTAWDGCPPPALVKLGVRYPTAPAATTSGPA